MNLKNIINAVKVTIILSLFVVTQQYYLITK